MQRLSGCTELDDVAQVIAEHLGIPSDIDVYPAVYASRPESDIRHAVKLRYCEDTFSQGMQQADSTVGRATTYATSGPNALRGPAGQRVAFPVSSQQASPEPEKKLASPPASPEPKKKEEQLASLQASPEPEKKQEQLASTVSPQASPRP